jgi:hypothetical protein
VIHKCVCGCGNEVVTPISPTDWQLSFNGRGITLKPSIGNWNFKCKTHYFIIENRVEFASSWSDYQKEVARKKNPKKKKRKWNLPFFGN